jgi:chromosome partitioning protein
MKGGVGKTTLASQIAHAADLQDLKILAIDLDPQSNLSQTVLGIDEYLYLLKTDRQTIVDVFSPINHKFSGSPPPPPNLYDMIIFEAGYYKRSTLDLLPSRLELASAIKNPLGKAQLLDRALANAKSKYDLILIDCAPTESVLSEAAYYASDYVLVPVKPEFMATIGLPLLARSLQDYRSQHPDKTIEICGIAFNHSSTYSAGPESTQAIREVELEARKQGWPIYETQIRYSGSYPKAARDGTPISKTKHARKTISVSFDTFFEEFLASVGISA